MKRINKTEVNFEELFKNEKIIDVELAEEAKSSYLDYAASVIVSRALPDIKDGLKPVHRKIIYSMYELGLLDSKEYRKCARIVGDALGKYHPHGDTAVYDAMVKMAQDFVTHKPIVDGHGNFGSIDGDSAAAMRYTEAKLAPYAKTFLSEIKKDTVLFTDNFDATEREPVLLPARLPNLLINGCSGIAVGIATSIPPHNVKECVDAIVAYIKNPKIDVKGIMQHIKGPDFPTGGIMHYAFDDLVEIYSDPKSSDQKKKRVVVRGKANIVKEDGKELIIISSIPYQVNKAKLIEKIADLVKNKKIEGVTDLRDESDRNGMRIVIEPKKLASCDEILEVIYKNTNLEDSFAYNFTAIHNDEPINFNILDYIKIFTEFQKDIVTNRTKHDVKKLELEVLELKALTIAREHIKRIIEITINEKSRDIIKQTIKDEFDLTDFQVDKIIHMEIIKLSSLEQEELLKRLKEKEKELEKLNKMLLSDKLLLKAVEKELLELADLYSVPRRTQII